VEYKKVTNNVMEVKKC
jgi:hypothetical protein